MLTREYDHRHRFEAGRATDMAAVSVLALIAVTLLWGDSVEESMAFVLVVFAAVLPTVVFVQVGGAGIPIFPTVALLHLPYYALPILSGHSGVIRYTSEETFRAAMAVVLFLGVATAMWRMILVRADRQAPPLSQPDQLMAVRLALAGLCVGVFFHLVVIASLHGLMGAFFGVVRSLAITFATLSCYLVGSSRGLGVLRGRHWHGALVGIGLLLTLTFSSLFLVGGVMYALAAVFGYASVTRRLPWRVLAVLLLGVTVLHAGKNEMRTRYWERNSNWMSGMTVGDVPRFVGEWIEVSIDAFSGSDVSRKAIDRASLLQMVLLAQTQTPARLDFLEGETYLMLPSVITPRFISPSKPASQVGMNLLNIRYGLLNEAGARATAISWGLIAEAYANFGICPESCRKAFWRNAPAERRLTLPPYAA